MNPLNGGWRRLSAAGIVLVLIAGQTFAASSTRSKPSEPDLAELARVAQERIVEAVAATAAAQAEAGSEAAPGEKLVFARSLARAIGQTELAALRSRRGAEADSPAGLLASERQLVIACLRLEFDFALRIGCIALAERELTQLEPWIQIEERAAWPAMVEAVAAMDYHDEPEVPDGEDVLALASNQAPTPAIAMAVEQLARAFPDRLRAQFPRLIFYRRSGREADLDRAEAELLRLAPRNRSVRRLVPEIRAFFAPTEPQRR
ncbi:hypothetical protein [Horticoccus sp. 23ND18S-11]|uniref:hypothetical protein n=1 Tax=Horticoccus sp. 23ND18S-11 TaxID=3391832 RepID=UPI0039C919E7